MTHTDRSIRTTENALADLLKCLGDEGYEACLSLIAEHLKEQKVWKTVEPMAEELTITPDTLNGWRKLHLVEGEHYIKVGKRYLYDRREIYAWLESRKASSKGVTRSESLSSTKGRSTRRLLKEPTTPR